jgi:hypothetical protein
MPTEKQIVMQKKRRKKMKQWYENLFENYAEKYEKECFVKGTLGISRSTMLVSSPFCISLTW